MIDEFEVVAASGSLRSGVSPDAQLPHRWSEDGVAVQTSCTGAHLLHLSVAVCVLNDLYRESASVGVHVDGVRVEARGSFDTETWRSDGITYRVQVDSSAAASDVARLVSTVDEVAEIPRVLRAGAEAHRID